MLNFGTVYIFIAHTLRSWQALPLAGKSVHQRLKEEIDKKGTAKQGEMDFVKFDTLGKWTYNSV